jgi:hypothetical protein
MLKYMILVQNVYLVGGAILPILDLHNPAIGEPIWWHLHILFNLRDVHWDDRQAGSTLRHLCYSLALVL